MSWRHTKGANHKPPSGIPAHGAGWGGEAKGAGKGGAHVPQTPRKKRGRGANAPDPSGQITPDTAAAMAAMPPNPEARQRRYDRIASREELHGFWSSVVFDEAEATNYRIAAAEKLHDRRYPLDQKDAGPTQVVIVGGLPDAT